MQLLRISNFSRNFIFAKKLKIATSAVHDVNHLDPDQIKLDQKAANKEITEYEAEIIPYNREYNAREQFRMKYNPLGGEEWRIPYEKTTDSKGNPKPAYFGFDENENLRTASPYNSQTK